MISFFRKIRQKLLRENRFTRYLVYAAGEIFLVMVGILIALQVNNWNQERIRKEEFLVTVEQIYNLLDVEIQALEFIELHLAIQNLYMDTLYNFPEKMSPSSIIGHLNYQDTEPKDFQTSVGFLLENLKVKPGNPEEIFLARNLTDYITLAKLNFSTSQSSITEILLKEGILTPELTFGISLNQSSLVLTDILNPEDLEKGSKLVQLPETRTALIKGAVLNGNQMALVEHAREVAVQIKSQIQKQYPEVKLLYENIGILGAGTSYQDWDTDIPLVQKSVSPSLWELELELNGGPIKFRENSAWSRNWGGRTFPKGATEWDGPNLEPLAGKYRIVLNLTDKTYEFIPIQPR